MNTEPFTQPEGTAGPVPDAAAAIRADMITLLFRQTKPAFVGNYIVAAFLVWVLWDRVDKTTLLAWLATTYLFTTIRFGFVLYFLHHIPAQDRIARWAWSYTATSFLSGVLWGSISWLFFLPHDPVTVLMVGIAVAGLISGSVGSHSAFPPTFYAFAIPTALPFIVRSFMLGGTLFSALGFLTFAFLIVNFHYSRNIWQTLRSSVQLRFENLALIRQLTQEKTRAELASQAKSHFLAAASHDLRQPVHALGLFASSLQLLGKQDQPKRELVESLAEQIQASLNNLGKLLNSLLDVSRLDAGIVEAKPRPVAIREVFDGLRRETEPMARNKKLNLRIAPSGLWIMADPVLLQRVLSNIVVNAIRYTENGRVTVGCRRRGNDVAIQVWDTGIGINERQLPHIFREFYQVENVRRDQEQGLGLGLAIVKRSADLMGAAIEVKSKPGKGSLFSVVLPRCTQPAACMAQAEEAAHTPPPGLGVLVIDDNQAILNATEALIASWGHRALVARSLDAAVTRAKHYRGQIDLILADYRLAENTTGPDAIRAVNAILPAPVKAAIITGDTDPERIQEAMASGYQLLHKPLAPAALLKVIEDAARASTSGERQPNAADPAG